MQIKPFYRNIPLLTTHFDELAIGIIYNQWWLSFGGIFWLFSTAMEVSFYRSTFLLVKEVSKNALPQVYVKYTEKKSLQIVFVLMSIAF